jgi:hypothetical protein
MWSTFLAIFLGVTVYTPYNIWIIFIIGIPAQIVISLCFGIRTGNRVAVRPGSDKKRKRVRTKTAKADETVESVAEEPEA